MQFTWNESNSVPKKCVETGGSNEKEEDEKTEVAWVKYEVQSPELEEKLKAEAWSSFHHQVFLQKGEISTQKRLKANMNSAPAYWMYKQKSVSQKTHGKITQLGGTT